LGIQDIDKSRSLGKPQRCVQQISETWNVTDCAQLLVEMCVSPVQLEVPHQNFGHSSVEIYIYIIIVNPAQIMIFWGGS
jgi:hypothetical protein